MRNKQRMKYATLFFLTALAGQSFAQENDIHFEKGLNWSQVLAKAKTENKYIFVDCYATWCGPCKEMDRVVYPNDTAGIYLNANFISVRMQMDTAKTDNDTIKMMYLDSHNLLTKYKVNAYPTFLFFDPDGQIVHRSLSFQKVSDFVQTAQNALNPNKQYYTLLRSYQQGSRDYTGLPELVKMTNQLGDKPLALQIAADYMHGYLDHLSEGQFLSKESQTFMTGNAAMVSSTDRQFKLCFNEPAKVDTATHIPDYASHFVNYVIYKEELRSEMLSAKQSGREPNWEQISQSIEKKFGKSYIEDNVVNAKTIWYRYKKDGQHYTQYLVEKTEKQFKKAGIVPGGGAMIYNNNAWDVFQYDNNKGDLEKALAWQEKVIQLENGDAEALDTKANLLYKLGRNKEAIKVETQAAHADPKDKGIAGALQKMRAGQPTWPVNAMQ